MQRIILCLAIAPMLLTITYAQDHSRLAMEHNKVEAMLVSDTSPSEQINSVLFQNNELSTRLDKLFYAYAACFPVEDDYVLNFYLLKSIAFAESRLNLYSNSCNMELRRNGFATDEPERGHSIIGKCRKYKGLFQEDQTFCEAPFTKFAHSNAARAKRITMPASYAINCGDEGRVDPDQNTLAAVFHFARNYKLAKKYCPNATEEDLISLLYIGHNDGVAVLRKHVLMIGTNKAPACDAATMEKYLTKYYSGHARFSVSQGLSKFRTGRNVIIPFSQRRQMTSNLIKVPAHIRNSICPVNHGQRLYPIIKGH